MVIRVKIIKSSEILAWYNNRVGEEYEVEETEESKSYLSKCYRVKKYPLMFIYKDDCEIIND